MDVDVELRAIEQDGDRALEEPRAQVRRLETQVEERTRALTDLAETVLDLEERAAAELAAGAVGKYNTALQKRRSQIHDLDSELALLRRAQTQAQHRAAEEQAQRATRLEARLLPLFVETVSRLDESFAEAERLNVTLAQLHQASVRHLGPLHALSQGFCFGAAVSVWRRRAAGMVRRRPAA
jgi:hypothetical protein